MKPEEKCGLEKGGSGVNGMLFIHRSQPLHVT